VLIARIMAMAGERPGPTPWPACSSIAPTIGSRQGGEPTSGASAGLAEGPTGKKTHDTAADEAGFESRGDFRQADRRCLYSRVCHVETMPMLISLAD
jgi:hypothetical protein